MNPRQSLFHSWVFPVAAVIGIAFGASIGVAVQAIRITSKPQEFISLAKITASVDSTERPEIVRFLEGPDLNRYALDRLRALQPNLAEVKVTIKVAGVTNSGEFKIHAIGTEPKYTRYFLNALLDEFMANKSKMEGASGSPATVAILERASGAVEDLQEWVPPIANAAAVGGTAGFVFSLVLVAIINPLVRPREPPPLPPVV